MSSFTKGALLIPMTQLCTLRLSRTRGCERMINCSSDIYMLLLLFLFMFFEIHDIYARFWGFYGKIYFEYLICFLKKRK